MGKKIDTAGEWGALCDFGRTCQFIVGGGTFFILSYVLVPRNRSISDVNQEDIFHIQ